MAFGFRGLRGEDEGLQRVQSCAMGSSRMRSGSTNPTAPRSAGIKGDDAGCERVHTCVMGQRNMGSGSSRSRRVPWAPWVLPSWPMGRSAGATTDGDAYADGGGAEMPMA